MIDGSFPCCFAKMQWELSSDTNQAGTPPLTDYPCKWTWPLGSRINVGLLTFWFGRSWSEVLDACHDPDVGWWCFFFPLLGVIHFLLSFSLVYILNPTMIETTICLARRLWPAWRTHLHSEAKYFKKVKFYGCFYRP